MTERDDTTKSGEPSQLEALTKNAYSSVSGAIL
jgi:hypothetical protein